MARRSAVSLGLLALACFVVPADAEESSGEAAPARRVLTIACDEPRGYTLLQRPDTPMRSEPDAIGGARPVFVIDSAKPEQATIIMSGSDIAGKDLFPPKATEGFLAHFDADSIVIIERSANSHLLYSFYPANGIAFMSHHKPAAVGGAVPPRLSTFTMSCTFSMN